MNPANADDAKLLRRLSRQDTLDIHLFDLDANYGFSKRINHRAVSRRELAAMLAQAEAHNAGIGLVDVDFLAAKAEMMRDRPL